MRTAERTLILGAAGGFGRLLGALLEPASVLGVDLAPAPDAPYRVLPADARELVGAEDAALRAADRVLVCLPEAVALPLLAPLAARLRPGALLVDTLSVKAPVARALAGVRDEVELLSLNPLFAPRVGLAGENVAAVTLRGGPRGAAFLALLRGAGATIVPLDADEHDRAAAAVQVAAHAAILAYAGALERLGPPPDGVSTPPSRALAALVDRVLAGAPEVYRHVQADNPHSAAARAALADALAELGERVASEDGFAALYARLRAARRSA